jgi:hypothetical protein
LAFGAAMLDSGIAMRLLHIFAAIAISMVIYFGLALLAGGIERSQLMALIRRRR